MVDLETDGTWGTATQVPGLSALNTGIGSDPSALSCDSSGNCVLVGTYAANDGTSNAYPFVTYESGGTWSDATEVSPVAALASNGYAVMRTLSCQSGGTCTGAGSYRDSSHQDQAFVASESGGTWSTPVDVATTSALPDESSATLFAISCFSDGNCSAGGTYGENTGPNQAIVVSESGGTWSDAIQVPGVSALNAGKIGTLPFARVNSISCTGAGSCTVGGSFTDGQGLQQDFVDGQVSGTWETAAPVPLTVTTSGVTSQVVSVSCWSPGNCNAGGDYAKHDFVAPERGGVWGIPISPAGALEDPNYPSEIMTVSCATDGTCGAGGDFEVLNGGYVDSDAFVADYVAASIVTVPGPPTKVAVVPGKRSATVSWSAPTSNGGSAVTDYLARASSSGGNSCETTATHCVISDLSPTTAYTFSVTAENVAGDGSPSSPTMTVYPFRPTRFTIEVSTTIVSKAMSFAVIAGDAKPKARVRLSMPHATIESCTADSLGQCSVAMTDAASGAFKLLAASGKAKSSITMYVPSVSAPSTITHGSTATITVTHCPGRDKVVLSLSDGRKFTGKASSAGTASFHIPMPKIATEQVRVTVNGTTLTPQLSIKVT